MATDTAPPSPAPGGALGPAPRGGRAQTSAADPTTHLWQLPVLLIGVGVFVSAWQGWLPAGQSDPASAFRRAVESLRGSYEKHAPDPEELKANLTRVATEIDTFPEHAPLARFHLGSGYVRLAEITPALEESRGYWTLARQHFERVDENQIRDPNDAPRLSFRKAKVRAAVGLPADAPAADLALLTTVLNAPPPGEEGGDTKRLIADLALRQNPPDLAGAKVALNDYVRSAGPVTPAASLARARLKLAAIFLLTKEYEHARKWLGQIGADAPVDVFAPAKAEMARVLMAEGDYAGATKELDALRAVPGLPTVYRVGSAYDLGVCKLRLREPDAALKLFEEAVKGTGEEAVAAAVQLAELHLRSQDQNRHKAAVPLLMDAVKAAKSAADFRNEFVAVAEVQAAFELAVTTLLADGAFEPALTVADAYGAVAASGREREKRADVLAAWGTAIMKSQSPTEAGPKLKAAADEYAALVAFQPGTDGKLELLRRASELYRRANDPGAAVQRLQEAVKLPNIPAQLIGSVWLELADAMLAAKQTDGVWRVFNEVMATEGYASTATRYRLARQFVDSRHAGLVPMGRALFEQIAKQQNVSPAEREYHERALTELANDLIQQGNFNDAEARVRTQLSIYPNGPEAPLARLLLGVCLLWKADAPGTEPADAAKWREEAVAAFKQIVADCNRIEQRNTKLKDGEQWLRLQASLRILKAYQQMGKSNDLLGEASRLLDQHKGTVDELIILSLMYHAFKQNNDPVSMAAIRDRMKEAFDKLPPSAFPQTGEEKEYSRGYWLTKWFAPEPNTTSPGRSRPQPRATRARKAPPRSSP